jgi:hypothetical protein
MKLRAEGGRERATTGLRRTEAQELGREPEILGERDPVGDRTITSKPFSLKIDHRERKAGTERRKRKKSLKSVEEI